MDWGARSFMCLSARNVQWAKGSISEQRAELVAAAVGFFSWICCVRIASTHSAAADAAPLGEQQSSRGPDLAGWALSAAFDCRSGCLEMEQEGPPRSSAKLGPAAAAWV